jgi:hypothetical protein
VVVIAFPFFFELVDEELELVVGDVADGLVGGGVVELDIGRLSVTKTRGS